MNPWNEFVRSEQQNIEISRAKIAEARNLLMRAEEPWVPLLTMFLSVCEKQMRNEEAAIEEYIIKRDQWTKDQMLLGKKIDRTKSFKIPSLEEPSVTEWMRLKTNTLRNLEDAIFTGRLGPHWQDQADRIREEIAAKLREVGA